MSKIEGNMHAWLVSDASAEMFANALRRNNHTTALSALKFGLDGMEEYGWTFVGMAEVSLAVQDENTIRQNMVAALREKKKTVLAQAQREAAQIEGKIQDLLAISCETTS